MPITREALAPFLGRRDGPVYLEHADGSAVSYGESATVQGPEDDPQLTLLDTESVPKRRVPLSHLVDVQKKGVAYMFVVTDEEDPDPGETITTRGA